MVFSVSRRGDMCAVRAGRCRAWRPWVLVVVCLLILVTDTTRALEVVSDIPIKPWRILRPSALPRPVHHASLVVVNHSLVILGGCVAHECARDSLAVASASASDLPDPPQYNTALLMDLRTGDTRDGATSFPPLTTFGAYSGQHAAVSINNVVYIVRACAVAFAETFPSSSDSAEALGRVAAVYSNAMFVNESFYVIPSDRTRVNASCVAVGNRIYIVGGYFTRSRVVTASVDALDVVTRHYYHDVARLEEPVMLPSVAAMTNGFVVVGGLIVEERYGRRSLAASTSVALFVSQTYGGAGGGYPQGGGGSGGGGVDGEFCVARLDPWWPPSDDEDVRVLQRQRVDTVHAPGMHDLLSAAGWDSLHTFLFAGRVFVVNANGTRVVSMDLREGTPFRRAPPLTRAVTPPTTRVSLSAMDGNTSSEEPATTTTTTTTTERPPEPGEPTIDFASSLIIGIPRVMPFRIPQTSVDVNTTLLHLLRFGGRELWTVRDIHTGQVIQQVARASDTVFWRSIPSDDDGDDDDEGTGVLGGRGSADVVGRDAIVLPTPQLPSNGVLEAPRGLLTLSMPDLDFRALCSSPRADEDVERAHEATPVPARSPLVVQDGMERCAVRVSGRRDCVTNAAGTLDAVYDGSPSANLSLSVSGSAYPVYVCVAYVAHFPARKSAAGDAVSGPEATCAPALWWTPVDLLVPLVLEASTPPSPEPPTPAPPDPTTPPDHDPMPSIFSVAMVLATVALLSTLLAALVVTHLQRGAGGDMDDVDTPRGAVRLGLPHYRGRAGGMDWREVLQTPPLAAPATEAAKTLWWWSAPRRETPSAPPPPASAVLAHAARYRARVAVAQDVVNQQASRYEVLFWAGEGHASLVFGVRALTHNAQGGADTFDPMSQYHAAAYTSPRMPASSAVGGFSDFGGGDDAERDDGSSEESGYDVGTPLLSTSNPRRQTARRGRARTCTEGPLFALKCIQCPDDSTRAAITRGCEQLRDLESYHPFLLRPLDLFVNYEVSFGRRPGGDGARENTSMGRSPKEWRAGVGTRRTVRFREESEGDDDSGEETGMALNGSHIGDVPVCVSTKEERNESSQGSLISAASAHPFYWTLRQRRHEVMQWRSTLSGSSLSSRLSTGREDGLRTMLEAGLPSSLRSRSPRYWSLCLTTQYMPRGNLQQYIASSISACVHTPADLTVGEVGSSHRQQGQQQQQPLRVLSECLVASIAYQVCSALHALHHHTSPMVHGDVKLTNILLRKPRRAPMPCQGATLPQTRASYTRDGSDDGDGNSGGAGCGWAPSGPPAALDSTVPPPPSPHRLVRLPECVRHSNPPRRRAGVDGRTHVPSPERVFLPVVLGDAGMSWFASEALYVHFDVALSSLLTSAPREPPSPMTVPSSSPAAHTPPVHHARDNSTASSGASSRSRAAQPARTSLSLSPQGQQWRLHGRLDALVSWVVLYVDVPCTLAPEHALLQILRFPDLFVNVSVPSTAWESPFLASDAAQRLAGLPYADLVPYWAEQLIAHGGLTLPALQLPLQRRYLSGLHQASQDDDSVQLSGGRARHRHHRASRAGLENSLIAGTDANGEVAGVAAAASPEASPARSGRSASASSTSSASSGESTITVTTNTNTTQTAHTRQARLRALSRRSRRRCAPFLLYWQALQGRGTFACDGGLALSYHPETRASLLAWPPPSPHLSSMSEGFGLGPSGTGWRTAHTDHHAAPSLTTTTTGHSQAPRRADGSGGRNGGARRRRDQASTPTASTTNSTRARTRTQTTSSSDIDFSVLLTHLLQREAGTDMWGLGVVLYQCMVSAKLAAEAPSDVPATGSAAAATSSEGEWRARAEREAREEAFYLKQHVCGRALTALMEDLLRQSLEGLAAATAPCVGDQTVLPPEGEEAHLPPAHSPWSASMVFEAAVRDELMGLGYTDALATLVASLLSPVPARRPRTDAVLSNLNVGTLADPPSASPPLVSGLASRRNDGSTASRAASVSTDTRPGVASSLLSRSLLFARQHIVGSTHRSSVSPTASPLDEVNANALHETPPSPDVSDDLGSFEVVASAVPVLGEGLDEKNAIVFCGPCVA